MHRIYSFACLPEMGMRLDDFCHLNKTINLGFMTGITLVKLIPIPIFYEEHWQGCTLWSDVMDVLTTNKTLS